MATETASDPVERRWRIDFDQAAAKIPGAWLVRDGDFVGIAPGHCSCDEQKGRGQFACLVCMYAALARVGYARGWL